LSYYSHSLILIFVVLFALSSEQSELEDVVGKKAEFLRKQVDYLQKKAEAKGEKWKTFYQAVNAFLKTYDKSTGEKDIENFSEDELIRFHKEIKHLNTLIPMQLPAGPQGPGGFGAYYTTLKYYPEWDKFWRVGPHADVVVRFDNAGYNFVFWRGTNYIPHWVSDNGIWYDNEFNETWPTRGCSEPMSDKQCRYSRVRIIESSPARIVVHWRYALCDVDYEIAWPSETTGWGDWTDEYYYIYPDAVGTRKITLHTSHFGDDDRGIATDDLGHEWHEGIIVYNAFVMPEEVLHVDAIHVANMNADTAKWSWENPGEPETPTPEKSNIVMMNTKSRHKPFVISPEDCRMDAYEGCQNGSRFRWRDHWPTTMENVIGRDASGRKAAHGSFFHITHIPIYKRTEQNVTKVLLHGMTDKSVGSLVPLAKSWLHPPALEIQGDSTANFENLGYDKSQRAYLVKVREPGKVSKLKLKLNAATDSPVINPAFVIKNWGNSQIELEVDGEQKKPNKEFQYGYAGRLEGNDLILWIPQKSNKPLNITIIPQY